MWTSVDAISASLERAQQDRHRDIAHINAGPYDAGPRCDEPNAICGNVALCSRGELLMTDLLTYFTLLYFTLLTLLRPFHNKDFEVRNFSIRKSTRKKETVCDDKAKGGADFVERPVVCACALSRCCLALPLGHGARSGRPARAKQYSSIQLRKLVGRPQGVAAGLLTDRVDWARLLPAWRPHERAL